MGCWRADPAKLGASCALEVGTAGLAAQLAAIARALTRHPIIDVAGFFHAFPAHIHVTHVFGGMVSPLQSAASLASSALTLSWGPRVSAAPLASSRVARRQPRALWRHRLPVGVPVCQSALRCWCFSVLLRIVGEARGRLRSAEAAGEAPEERVEQGECDERRSKLRMGSLVDSSVRSKPIGAMRTRASRGDADGGMRA